VLLVDDEKIFLSSLHDGLRRRFPNMTFRTAEDGELALEVLGKHPVDLVITDLRMPKMDGFELIAAMHSKHPRVPVLIMTAHSTEISEGRAQAAGALHCIDKPVDLSDLASRIDELFSTGALATLRGVSLASFLQLLGMEKKSGVVEVRSATYRARLYLQDGQLVHADDDQRNGIEVALHTVGLEDVEINFRPAAMPKHRTIDLSLTQILLDSARIRDEGKDIAEEEMDLAFAESTQNTEVIGAPVIAETRSDNVDDFGDGPGEEMVTSPIKTIPQSLIDQARTRAAESVTECLNTVTQIDGVKGAALLDFQSGELFGALAANSRIDIAAAGRANIEVVRAKVRALRIAKFTDQFEDILISVSGQYHVITFNSRYPTIFMYVVLSRAEANLALARHLISEAMKTVVIFVDVP
jgi:CheY-like chemotaxis protein